MKVGIVTLIDYRNYGNRLQNYALTKLLENEGIEVVNGIQVFTKEEWINNTHSLIKKTMKRLAPFFLIKNRLYQPIELDLELDRKKQERFIQFTNQYTSIIGPVFANNLKQAGKMLERYNIDYYITGSDQVWNPFFGARENEFLTFAESQKRFSFAASIGVNEIPVSMMNYYRDRLSQMNYLSVRESSAKEIIFELTGREADVTFDPSLLLDRKIWDDTAKKPNIHIEEKYICTYFLGEVPPAVKAFANKTQLPVYNLNCINEPQLYTLDPAEFLYMIKNAEYVLTDSFHAVAFSIKFNKEFYVFEREQRGVSSMFSRIETITKHFNLNDRIQDRSIINEENHISNWNVIEKELMREKKRSLDRLTKGML